MTNSEEDVKSTIIKYNLAFQNQDYEELRNLYLGGRSLVYMDNQAGCDTACLKSHLEQVRAFFQMGEQVAVKVFFLDIFVRDRAACAIALIRYATRPESPIRATFYLESHEELWRIRHVHFSEDPNNEDRLFE